MSSSFSEDAEIVGCTLQKRYIVGEVIGKGGFAVVYKGRDNNLGRDVALKVPRKDIRERPGFQKRFEAEKNRMVQVGRHSNIVAVTDAHVFEGIPYLVLDFMPGRSLRTVLHRDGRQTVDEVSAWLFPIAYALDFIHHIGIIHLDVKPGNILYDAEGQAMLSDFGIARVMELSETNSQIGDSLPGSPNYMAPEAEIGQVTKAYDQYSLGVIVYQALTGQRPPRATLNGPPVTPPDDVVTGLSPGCSDAIVKAMSPDPGKRFASCREFAEAVSGLTVTGTPTFGTASSTSGGFGTRGSVTTGMRGVPSDPLPPATLPLPGTAVSGEPALFSPEPGPAVTDAGLSEMEGGWAEPPGLVDPADFSLPPTNLSGAPLTAGPPARATEAGGTTRAGTATQLPSASSPRGGPRITKTMWIVAGSIVAALAIVGVGLFGFGGDDDEPSGDGVVVGGGEPVPAATPTVEPTSEPTPRPTVDPGGDPPIVDPPIVDPPIVDPPIVDPPSEPWTIEGGGRTVRVTSPVRATATLRGTDVRFEGRVEGFQPGDILYVEDERIPVDRETGAFSQVVPFGVVGVHEVHVTVDNRGDVVLDQKLTLRLE